MVPHLVGNVGKILTEMGLYGSVWVDTEGVRSHMGYKGSGIANGDMVCYNILKYFLDVGSGKGRAKQIKEMMLRRSPTGTKNLSWTCADLFNLFR